ncbi:uncharacterized protein B0H18DRAFT_649375 [Fomitopsis serialis]|uniref:uncharacterized protein n=1 Tax=Fomitopsis serialis TaxID=139415 RepID=UPI0020087559|nr:uncharacterized protein B0H18DRAFT_649375 [Neoantrodia serialis]KAH9919228.1 hypothetical protein B0H18DRAFT_649375 [Neoantrodia serialis]
MRVCGGGGVTADEDGISHILVTSSSAPRQSSLARHLHAEPPTASHAYPPSGRSCTTVPLKVIRVTVPCSCSPPTYTQRPPRRDSRKSSMFEIPLLHSGPYFPVLAAVVLHARLSSPLHLQSAHTVCHPIRALQCSRKLRGKLTYLEACRATRVVPAPTYTASQPTIHVSQDCNHIYRHNTRRHEVRLSPRLEA